MRVIALLFMLSCMTGFAFAEDSGYNETCTKECSFLTKDCTAYLDCRVAKVTCVQDCMQRKVWEKVAVSLDRLTVALEAQSQKSEKETEILEQLLKNSQPAVQKNENINQSSFE
ncbi:MAG: hypothetical protein ABH865_02055 [Candidatus Omnitrophota bacterium]|nr:hypothetical protein [Candidatus Omnitrophota bacterium]